MESLATHACAFLKTALKTQGVSGFTPKIGLILGSGLGSLVSQMHIHCAIPYSNIPGFCKSSVPGHAGDLVLGTLYGVPVMCMKGRYHIYEGIAPQQLAIPLQTMKAMGCHTLVLTNAAGSLRAEVGPGSISIIEDHINFTGTNALLGHNNPEIGLRFVPMENAYDPLLRAHFLKAAKKVGFELPSGIYIGVLGPSYETPAEIRAFRILGGDLVGMSTVNEVIAARHCGLRVVGLSAICNFAAGMTPSKVNHEEVLEYGAIASEKLKCLIESAFPEIESV